MVSPNPTPGPKKRIAYSYIRFSSKIQERGLSLARQTDYAAEYVAKHGLMLDDSLHLKDLGVSAYKGKNAKTGALAGFLAAVNTGRVPRGSLLLIENLDRLSRDELSISVALFLNIINAGIDIVSLMDNRVYQQGNLDMTGMIISIAVLSRGHEESQTKSIRVHDAYVRRLTKAREQNGKYRITKIGPAWLKPNDTGGWDIIEERAQIVREIYRWYDEGFGKWKICGILNQRGLKSFSGTPWNAAYVSRILTTPATTGNFRPGHWIGGRHRYIEGQDVKNYFPRVISDQLYARCYNRLKGKYYPPSPPGRIHLLSGITFYPERNERAVVWATSKSDLRINGVKTKYRYFYFVPSTVPSNRHQKYQSWNMDNLERSFLLFCSKVDWAAIAAANQRGPRVDWAARRHDLEKRLSGLKSEISNLYGLAARGDLSGTGDQIKERELEQHNKQAELDNLLNQEEQEKAAEDAIARGMASKALMDKVLNGTADQDTRIRLREEIRRRVERVDLYEHYNLGAAIERETGIPLKQQHVRCYRVTFRNGAVRWVMPAGKKDCEFAFIYDDLEKAQNFKSADLKPLPRKFDSEKPQKRTGKSKGIVPVIKDPKRKGEI